MRFWGNGLNDRLTPQNFLEVLPAYDGEVFLESPPAEMNEMGGRSMV